MFYFPLTRIVDSAEFAVAAGATITAEGQALVASMTNGVFGVKPSAGGAGEVFVGLAVAGTSAAPFAASYASKVEVLTVPASGTLTLQFAPVTGQAALYNTGTNAALAIDGTTVTLASNKISGLTPGLTFRVTYKYALTVNQARALQGDVQPGGNAGDQLGSIGVVKRGSVFTTEFDASKNWAAATGLKLAANGQITDQTGSGVTITGAFVTNVPSATNPYLGFEFSAA